MYDDFWAGYNYGNTQQQPEEKPKGLVPGQYGQVKFVYSGENRMPGTYDKSKLIKMKGPNGEEGEIYADGKMYIIFPGGKAQKRTFPSRPWGIRYMQKRGWVLA